tara:strand:+ start:316 stop:768 length:453 start_codon:yes stop_codon:yes gene_type:complete
MSKSTSSNKKVRNATAKVYKGIKFRSKLELFAYIKLEEAGIKALYEEKKYTLMEGFYFDSVSIEPSTRAATRGQFMSNEYKVRNITYTPDFVDPNGKWIIEVKGFANDTFPLKWKLFKKHLQEAGTDIPILYLPKNQGHVLKVIDMIKAL